MDKEVADRSMRLFASEVMPVLREMYDRAVAKQQEGAKDGAAREGVSSGGRRGWVAS
jgi:hypothetical protein